MVTLDCCSAEILKILLLSNNPISSKKISEEIGVSARAVQYRIKRIRYFLHNYDLEIISRPHYGIQISGNTQEITEVLNELDSFTYINKRERLEILKLILLTSVEPITYTELAEKFSISKNTVSNEIREIRSWFKCNGILLDCKQNYGCILLGGEINFREAIIQLIYEDTFKFRIENVLMKMCFTGNRTDIKQNCFAGYVQQYFVPVDFIYMNNLLNTILNIPLPDPNAFFLLISLAVQVVRIIHGKNIGRLSEGLGDLHELDEYYKSNFYAKKIEDLYRFSITLDEISFTTKKLLQAKKGQKSRDIESEMKHTESTHAENLTEFIESFANCLSKKLHPSLLYDREFCNNLRLHLEYLDERRVSMGGYQYPFDAEIIKSYPKIYEVVDSCIKNSELVRLKLPSFEKAFLTIHVASALERLNYSRKRQKSVLLVCNTGASTAILLKAKITSEFPDIFIIDVISYKQILERSEFKDIDYIISTIPLHLYNAPPVLVVNPLLMDKDIDNLKQAFIIAEQSNAKLPIKNAKDGKKLFSLINSDLIKLKTTVKDRDEAIENVGKLLLDNGYVEKDYISALKEVLVEFGPYMIAWPGVALLHAAGENGVKKMGMSLMTLNTPINFGHKENDPVDIVMCLSIPTGKPITLAMEQLNDLLTSDEIIGKIRKTRNKRTVLLEIAKICNVQYEKTKIEEN